MSELTDDFIEPEVLTSDVVFEGKVWNIRRDRFVLDDDEIVREYTDHPGAVAVLALDERDRVLLIKQYRHPIEMRDWELPAGLLDVRGESPLGQLSANSPKRLISSLSRGICSPSS